MPDLRISQLPFVETVQDADVLAVAIYAEDAPYTSGAMRVGELASYIVNDRVEGEFLPLSGGILTGDLGFENPLAAQSWNTSVDSDGNLAISGSSFDQIMSLNSGTAGEGNTGQLITGRFRYSMPVMVQNTAATLSSGAEGVTTGLVRCSNGSPVTLTIRANTASNIDFDVGNFFSVVQEGGGQVTLVGEDANVSLLIPAGYIAATRDQYSVISATYIENNEGVQRWLISGDLAEAS